MLTTRSFLVLVTLLTVLACSNGTDDFVDHNRPDTYGAQCQSNDECASPFGCLGPSDAGPYWPICTVTCTTAENCPSWSATGHCPGPITPVCDQGFCDYQRCE
jgi:hypothetical protein